MPTPYGQLLDATIQHLQNLKARGVRFVATAPATLEALTRPPASAPLQEARPSERGRSQAHTALAAAQTSCSPVPATSSPPNPGPGCPENRQAGSLPCGAAVLDPQAKAEAMKELRTRALACVKCPHLASSRKNVVFGVGDINASLMFVGEAPGVDEDQQGEPFVGAAGQLLTRIILTMNLTRDKVYIANILKCRPDTPGQAYGNRKPTAEEMQTCIPYLESQIDLIQPKVLVALGATAVEGLLGKTEGITRLRGHWRSYRGIPLMPTFHPSYLLRNQALSEKRKVWEDMLQVLEKLEMPVSEKQLGYFLKA